MEKKIEKATNNPGFREHINAVTPHCRHLAMPADILNCLDYWNLVGRGQGCY